MLWLAFVLWFLCSAVDSQLSNGENNNNSYGLCDVGGPITAHNGSFHINDGVECTRVLLAPKGWRILILIHELYLDKTRLVLYDGGTVRDTQFLKYEGGHGPSSGGPDKMYSTSNAVVVHSDPILAEPASKFKVTFTMFPQSPERCACPPVSEGNTLCRITTGFYRGNDAVGRICTTTCNDRFSLWQLGGFGYVAHNVVNWQCAFDQTKTVDQAQWNGKFVGQFFPTLDVNLISCNPIYPLSRTITIVHFNVNTTCASLDLHLIDETISGHVVDTKNSSYVGECFKFKNVSANSNCTVKRITLSCTYKTSTNMSLVELRLKDNIIINVINSTITAQTYQKLLANYDSLSTLENVITKQLNLNSSVMNYRKDPYGLLYKVVCPQGSVVPILASKSCVACPRHFYKNNAYANLYFTCAECKPEQHRELSEDTCVNGTRNYTNRSLAFCPHTCALGKYFNNGSGLCEWCPYGTYQNSTTEVNPVCKPCLQGKSTGFVGAIQESDCIYLCKAGRYLKDLSCLECPIATYMPHKENRLHKCYKCPSGDTTISLGAKNISDCYDKCQVGEYFNISKSACLVCPNNTYQDETFVNNTNKCKTCPPNTITAGIGSTKLSNCIGPCSEGQFVDLVKRKCSPCKKNTYMELNQHAILVCKVCGKHKITENQGSTNISDCIYTCNKGDFFNKTTEVCEKCLMDSYQDEKGRDVCEPCLGMSFTVKLGSTRCITPCIFGKFLNISAEQCQDCPTGHYQNETNHRFTTCEACALDYYNNQPGRANCTTCPGQTITVITAAESLNECIERCQPGMFLNRSRKNCQDCHKGFYQTQANYRLEHCVECPTSNLTTLEIGAKTLEDCVGYCASSPCYNGGNCMNVNHGFKCNCPKNLEGETCETIIDANVTDSMQISVHFPNMTWREQLANEETKEFKEHKYKIEKNTREELGNSNIRTVNVAGFTEGSVVADMEFQYVALANFTSPADTLYAIVSDGKLGNLTVDGSSLKILNYTCIQPLGMEDGRIPDEAITSGNKDSFEPPSNARLNYNQPGWAPNVFDIADAYLQVDFQKEVILTGIATQGSSYRGGSWLIAYEIKYSLDGKNWIVYKGDNIVVKVFWANDDVNTVVRNDMKYPVQTRYVRVFRYDHKHAYSYRVEFYGCPSPQHVVVPISTPSPPVLPTTQTNYTDTASPAVSTTDNGGVKDKDDDDDDTNVGLIVGVVIGVIAFLVLIIILVWCVKTNKGKKAVRSNSYQLKHTSH